METLLTQVWNPEVRPLAEEAWRSYNAGALRASIAATWTAVTADVIGKVVHVADDGDADAVVFRRKLDTAQANGLIPAGVREMQTIEDELLTKAVAFELIDTIDSGNSNASGKTAICSFTPSLRTRPETVRAHLATALATLLTNPPVQGKKATELLTDDAEQIL